jgi:hypothetical protein
MGALKFFDCATTMVGCATSSWVAKAEQGHGTEETDRKTAGANRKVFSKLAYDFGTAPSLQA